MRKLLLFLLALLAACSLPPSSQSEITPTSRPDPTPTANPSPTPTAVPTPTIQAAGRLTLGPENSRIYRYPLNTFIRPLAVASTSEAAYLLDGGRLLRADLGDGTLRQVPYPPEGIEGTPVKELSDLAVAPDGTLILLDRSGDVYRWEPVSDDWRLERLAVIEAASPRQYLAAVAAWEGGFYLLDINTDLVWRHIGGQVSVVLTDPLLHEAVDLAVDGGYFLIPGGNGSDTVVRLRPSGEVDGGFSTPEFRGALRLLELDPGGLLYVLEEGSSRILGLDPETGALVQEIALSDSSLEILALSARDGSLQVAARDTLYLYPGLSEEAVPSVEVPPLAAPPNDPRRLAQLPVLGPPMEETLLTDLSFRLPGAPRRYRYGVHEGTDFFWAAGGPVQRGTPVLAVADGTVVRADWEYLEPTGAEMQALLDTARARRYTPPEILDRLRGRQVRLDLGSGAVVYYSHLSGIADGIVVGARVKRGDVLGHVGNSGTPEAQISPDTGVHLHLEIRIGDGYLGQHLRHPEVRAWHLRIFGWD